MGWKSVLLFFAGLAACSGGSADAGSGHGLGERATAAVTVEASVSAEGTSADEVRLAEPGAARCSPWQPTGPRCAPRRPSGSSELLKPSQAEAARLSAIHDDDDRLDLYCIDDRQVKIDDFGDRDALQRNADASAALFLASVITGVNNGTATTLRVSRNRPLCSDEAFADQPLGAWCSAVFVSPTSVLASRHCVPWTEIDQLRIVRGFRAIESSREIEIHEDQICHPLGTARIFGDHQLIILDVRCPTPQVAIAKPAAKIPGLGEQVYAIGYPTQLPAKYSGVARVVETPERRGAGATPRFTANLDAHIGNSGSPVFDSRHELVGVVEWTDEKSSLCRDGGCYRWRRCPRIDGYCNGTTAIDATSIGPYIHPKSSD